MREKIREMVRIGSRRMVIDLGEVRWADSRGLGLLLETRRLMQDGGGELRLARIADKIEDLIEIAQLTREFKTYPTVAEAIHDLTPAA